MPWRFVGTPTPSQSDLPLIQLAGMAVEQMGLLAGHLEKLWYDLDPLLLHVPGSQMLYGEEIPTTPEPRSLASDLIRWGSRSIAHQKLILDFKGFLKAAVGAFVPIFKLMIAELRPILGDDVEYIEAAYGAGELAGLTGPPRPGAFPIARAINEARWAIQLWNAVGYALGQHPQLKPIWEAWHDSAQIEEYAEQLEDLFLTEVPPQERLQPRDWLYY